MKFDIQTPRLKDVVKQLERVAGKHVTLPVLSCILIDCQKDLVVFRATNLDVGIEISIPAKTTQEGIIAVPAHTFSAFVSQLASDAGITSVEEVSGNVRVHTSKSQGVIKAVPAEDFPPIPKILDGEKTKIPSEALIKGLKSVWYSASVSSVKPELSSVYIYKDGDYMVFAATDSFRLAEKKVKVSGSINFKDTLIPFKNVSELIRTAETLGGDLNITSNKNLLAIEADGLYTVSRVIDGVFPDYRQIIPKTHTTEIVALKEDVINGLKISNVFSDKFNQVRFVVDPKKKIFEVQTKNSDIGENKTLISATLEGEPIEVNFNYKYIADCFQSIDADSITMKMSGLNKPMVISPTLNDTGFTYIVMPMNR